MKRALRRFQAETHMKRRLSEDRNQHYTELNCPCWTDPKTMARFKEQPKFDCHCPTCGCERYYRKHGPTIQERRAAQEVIDDYLTSSEALRDPTSW